MSDNRARIELARNSQTLLLTGATGMVGSYVMADWLRSGGRLAVLARGKGSQSASDRVDQILRRFENAWDVSLTRPRVFLSDLHQPGLGLTPEETDWIARNCDQILHSAASLSFAPASESVENEPYRTNVDGTVRILDFCIAANIRQFHHISTAYVCGHRSGRVLECEADVKQDFANDYERSKSIAEALLGDALAAGKLQSLTVYRPSIVIDRTGLSPTSGDRTIYGAFSMYQMLASRFGLPDHGEWFRNLGFAGDERKNIVDVDWISKALLTIVPNARYHNQTYHLTSTTGTMVRDLDAAFRIATQTWLARPTRVHRNAPQRTAKVTTDQQVELDRMAAPFVKTFLPYFRDDPQFGREQIDHVVAETDLPPTPEIQTDELLQMVRHWSAFVPKQNVKSEPVKLEPVKLEPVKSEPVKPKELNSNAAETLVPNNDPNEVVICGYEVRLPGGVENAEDFAKLLWAGRSAIEPMPADRLDRELYFDTNRNLPGKTYTQLGGCVSPQPLDAQREKQIQTLGVFDLTHRQFAQVAMAAVQATFGSDRIDGIAGLDPLRAGVLVGHSGGTQEGGPLAMSTLAAATSELIEQTELQAHLGQNNVDQVKSQLTHAIRHGRPTWRSDGSPHYNAYSVASLTANLIGARGRREVIDAACSSSLLALHHAVSAMAADHLDVAVVGGATFNNVDNLALFSQSGACSDEGCYPFDRRASGLISSEGYVAVVLARRSVAERLKLPIHAAIVGVGVASDGKGKGLWAPRSEGQQLAVRRAVPNGQSDSPQGDEAGAAAVKCLDIDYLECHATSTQVGDATELESLTALLRRPDTDSPQLAIGSVKSNLGHLLEAAGLVGMVKCLIAMQRGELPPSIHFEQPNETYDWTDSPVRVVDSVQPWPQRNASGGRVAGINAFGIGGLNAHAVIRQSGLATQVAQHGPANGSAAEPIAIVGRGVVLPGATDIAAFAELLRTGACCLSDPPAGRWPLNTQKPGWVGVADGRQSQSHDEPDVDVPHCRGGYIDDFEFDAQSYRIPPKTVRYANPAQLMLIQATAQAIQEFDGGTWSVDRARVSVVVGTIFGGEFSNALQIGLRLPEIRQHFLRIAQREGLDADTVEKIAEQFRQAALLRYPALLDETGGFTASTLASRIARTFDLMGGACAVDADEASGGLAILTAMEQLRTHQTDTVLCGTTHRSMDLVAFEQLYRKNQLVHSGRPEDVPKDGSRIFPGEGVAIMMLQRLSDAKAQNKTIFGVLEQGSETWTDDVARARAEDSRQSMTHSWTSAPRLLAQIGHLGGGQGIVRTIAATIAFGQSSTASQVRWICETAQDGYQIQYQIAHQPTPTEMNRVSALPTTRPDEKRSSNSLIQIRLQSNDFACIEHDLRLLAEQTDQGVLAEHRLQSIVPEFRCPHSGDRSDQTKQLIQAAIIARDAGEVAAAAQALIAGPLRQRETSALPKHFGWLRIGQSTGDRVGWLFPGQGSQYAAVPRLFAPEFGERAAESAWSFFDDIDKRLKHRGIAAIRDRLADPQGQLGRDVWWTQLWVLAVSATMTDSLMRRGQRPDVVLGHSFGECTAAWAAGAMDMDQAIEFAKCRSDAVVMTRQGGGELLSVRGEPSAIQAVIDRHQLPTVISHHNSPTNTVVAGMKAEIAATKKHLAAAGMASVVISVPAAFHTAAMEPAQDLLRARFGGQRLMPPRLSFLSAVSNRYLAEPTEMMDNLIDQLTQPVCFHGALQRIVAEGAGLLIEVGPDNVLTRLARETVDGRAICLAADDRSRDYRQQQILIDLAVEAFHGHRLGDVPTQSVVSATLEQDVQPHLGERPSHAGINGTTTVTAPRFEVVDVTRNRRRPQEANEVRGSTADVLRRPIPRAKAIQESSYASAQRNGSTVMDAGTGSAQTLTEQSAVATTIDLHGARSFLFDLVVDLTGYDPEIIDFEADLEAELGVDSIKKAQLIGEMVQWADVAIETQAMQLAKFETLNDILGILGECDHELPPVDESIITEPTAEFIRASNELATSQTSDDHSRATISEDESLRRLMIDLVVDQTGYDESIIDMDADMEGELGIDSIKKAQLLGELEQQYQLQSLRDSGLSLADFSTLESIRAFVWEQISVNPELPDTASADTTFETQKKNDSDLPVVAPVPATGTHRFVLEMRPVPRLDRMPTIPNWHGPAVVLGSNAMTDAIIARWQSDSRSSKYPIQTIDPSLSAADLEAKLDAVWADGVSPHLFITTPHDSLAVWATSDSDAWQTRRSAALSNPYRVCQRWMQGLIDQGEMSHGTLATLVQSGGDFNFQGSQLVSAESGGLAGLTKAMLIEAWMRGYRDTPMLVIDAIPSATAAEVAEGIWRELAVPSYDEEVAVSGEHRFATSARYSPLPNSTSPLSPSPNSPSPICPGGNWIIAGGGRGITAMTAMELASRYELKLHLLGTAPVPQIDDKIRTHAATDRGELRRRVMTQTQSEGGNPVIAWQKLEKAIEIDQTLQACRERSIQAEYHSVDVSDVEAVESLLERIRETDGPIRGVIQGAGAGQDARFDRKRPDKVEQCFRAKIDGCVALAAATAHDPLDWFIGFGSISGRFGANGHTDYSAANDMLAKLINNLQHQRPETRCVTFHWHAWGDVGMATKPEAKLALDMIGMEFMPAQDGLQHFLNEIQSGGDATEVLITDRRYVRKFFPEGEAFDPSAVSPLPLLDPDGHRTKRHNEQRTTPAPMSYVVTLDPTRDRFLSEHLVQGRPTLPFVMAIEMLAQAARGTSDHQVIACHDVKAHHPLKCLTSDSFAVELVPSSIDHADASLPNPAQQRWTLVSDLRRRDGRLVEASRPHFSATIQLGASSTTEKPANGDAEHNIDVELQSVSLANVEYLGVDAPVYHGPSLQCLRQIGFTSDNSAAVGWIAAPSPAHLAGEHRPLRGWSISPAAMDAMLYAAGMLAYRFGKRPSLPISFDRIDIHRLPRPGEPLRVIVRVESQSDSGAVLSATLSGLNDDSVLRLIGYRIGWLG